MNCDEQLILAMTFNQAVKIHSLKIKAPSDKGPKTIRIFQNQPNTLDLTKQIRWFLFKIFETIFLLKDNFWKKNYYMYATFRITKIIRIWVNYLSSFLYIYNEFLVISRKNNIPLQNLYSYKKVFFTSKHTHTHKNQFLFFLVQSHGFDWLYK